MRLLSSYGLILVVFALIFSCKPEEKLVYSPQHIATTWMDMALYITKHTPSNSPTYASRVFGYIGLTMFESIAQGFSSHRSVADQLNGLGNLPVPDPSQEYDWTISLNAAQASILKSLYNQTADSNKVKIDSLEQLFLVSLRDGQNKNVVKKSIDYGIEIAEHIFEWSKTDGGHRGYLNNFDESFIHPEHPGSWKPPLYAQSFSHHPLHPHWGKNRTFLAINSTLPIPDIIPYDETPESAYYQQFLLVYEKDKILTQQDKETAIWWGDDPDETFTPAGHSFYIATLALRKKNPTLIECAETYARIGMAVADAFINCWAWKYHHFSERPNTFMPKFIDPDWVSFWPDPPFPAFPSGHAIQAAAAAAVLMDLYGNQFTFIDRAHVGRKRDELRDTDFVERTFDNFWAAAQETADSRFYGGIHTPQDNEVGLQGGKEIAYNVNKLKWKSDE